MAHESPESGCLPMGPRIVIIGAGVVGLSCAHQILKEIGNAQITVVAEGFMNQTTTFGSGGLWEPYQIAGRYLVLIKNLLLCRPSMYEIFFFTSTHFLHKSLISRNTRGTSESMGKGSLGSLSRAVLQ